MIQSEALHFLKMGKNVFLTGAAGAGKTYLLNQYIRYLKENNVRVAITASTGIAATHLQGQTIHAWSGIGVKDFLTQHDLEKLADNDRVKRNYKKNKVLVIDEISMLHPHQLDMVDTISRFMLNSDEPFGGMQIILCGDFFQLPPIASVKTGVTAFAFESTIWNQCDLHICYLDEQYRQKDDPLLTILNDIRSGTAGEHTKIPLRTRYKKEPIGNTRATKLYSRNINVDAINEKALSDLPGSEKIFHMKTTGFKKLAENLKKSNLAMEKLRLKIGAEVMFIKNDMAGRYVNGTRGHVVGFDRENGWPVVKTFQNEVITACEEEWKYEENGAIRAIITQVPLRLAWAITIHKSQGMTLDTAEIDLGDAFEPGMGYVALSRVRTLNGLKLMNLNAMALTVHPKILEQDHVFKKLSSHATQYLHNFSDADIMETQQTILQERFEGNREKIILKKSKAPKKQKIPTHFVTLELLKKKLSIADIAQKRVLAASTIITHLEILAGLKQINLDTIAHLKESISPNDFDLLFSELEKSEDGKLSPIYEKLNGRYAYSMLRTVRLFAGLPDE